MRAEAYAYTCHLWGCCLPPWEVVVEASGDYWHKHGVP